MARANQRPETKQPKFVSAAKARTGIIKIAVKSGYRTLTNQQVANFMEELTQSLRSIRMIGHFSLSFRCTVRGNQFTKGLLIFGQPQHNAVCLTYQVNGNDRFAFNMSLPPQLVNDVHAKLKELLNKGDQTDVEQKPTESEFGTQTVESPKTHTTVHTPVSREYDFSSADGYGPLLLSFDEKVRESHIPLIVQRVRPYLNQVTEGMFVVRAAPAEDAPTEVTLPAKDDFVLCPYQPGTMGQRFFFRPNSETGWLRFALVAQDDESIEALGEVAQQATKESPLGTPKRSIGTPETRSIDAHINDVSVLEGFLVALAQQVNANQKQWLRSADLQRLYKQEVATGIAAPTMGKIFTAWSRMGYLRRRDGKASSSEYSLGLKASTFLPESLQGLAGRSVIVPSSPAPAPSPTSTAQPQAQPAKPKSKPLAETASADTQVSELKQQLIELTALAHVRTEERDQARLERDQARAAYSEAGRKNAELEDALRAAHTHIDELKTQPDFTSQLQAAMERLRGQK